MHRVVLTAWVLVLSAIIGIASAAADEDAGKRKSATCAACHGATGISNNEMWPNLNGQKAGYLVKQLRAFRDGARRDPSMDVFVKALSDQDIQDLAAFYAQQKPD